MSARGLYDQSTIALSSVLVSAWNRPELHIVCARSVRIVKASVGLKRVFRALEFYAFAFMVGLVRPERRTKPQRTYTRLGGNAAEWTQCV